MARRQEQEEARPGATEVAPGVLRLELPVALPGLGHVNCYALIDRDGATVIDPGLPGEASWRALMERLRDADLELRHIHTVFVTHSHPDHFGGATRIAREAGARIVAHRSFDWPRGPSHHAEVSADDLAAQREELARQLLEDPEAIAALERARSPWGSGQRTPSPVAAERWQRFARGELRNVPLVSDPVEHGQVLRLGQRDWCVHHTPGHTQDHVCLQDPDTGVFLAGDHVLPTITPHISGVGTGPDPLKAYLASLGQLAEVPSVSTVLPAHGHPFRDLAGRAAAIQRHHLERLDRLRGISQELGAATVEQYMQGLFAERSWGWMAESETYAHLEHLRQAGEAERYDENGRLHYITR